MDKRNDRVQPIRLSPDFFPLDIHKSMFINDLTITIPSYYVKNWGQDTILNHNRENFKWDVDIEKAKQDIATDINSVSEAIQLLAKRKSLLEEKLTELNHPELIAK